MGFVQDEYTAKECFRSVGQGWSKLIRILWRNKPKDVKIVQVKEKFGLLRVYTEPYNEEYQIVIDTLESVSAYTCERCGNRGRRDTSFYWIKTLCTDCRKKRADQENRY